MGAVSLCQCLTNQLFEVPLQDVPAFAALFADFELGHKEMYSMGLPDLTQEEDAKAQQTKAVKKKTKAASQLDLDFPPLLSTATADKTDEKGMRVIVICSALLSYARLISVTWM